MTHILSKITAHNGVVVKIKSASDVDVFADGKKLLFSITTTDDVIADFSWTDNLLSLVSKNKHFYFEYDTCDKMCTDNSNMAGASQKIIKCILYSPTRPVVLKRTFDEMECFVNTMPLPTTKKYDCFITELTFNGRVDYIPVNIDKGQQLGIVYFYLY